MLKHRHNYFFALVVILFAVVYSGVILKTNLDVIKSSKKSLVLQKINVQELSSFLGNMQLHISRYTLSRQKSSLDSVYKFENLFKLQSDSLYYDSQEIPELRKDGLIIFQNFPRIMAEERLRIKNLPPKIGLDNMTAVFNKSEDSFSILWEAIDRIRNNKLKSIKQSTHETVSAGSRAWVFSILGSILLLVIFAVSYWYIQSNYKKQLLLESKEMASEKLRKEKEKLLQAVIDNCTALVFLKDKKFKYTLVNRSFRQLMKLNNVEIIGKTHDEIVIDAKFKHQVIDETEIITSGKIQETTDNLKSDESSKYFHTTKFPLYDSSGEIFGLGGISTDITEQVNYENELMQGRKIAESAKIAQQRFLANMSHEIRTPMNGIIGMTNLLQSTSLDVEQQDYLNVIQQSSNILMMLINDILDVSKIQAGMLKLEKIPFKIRDLTRQVFLSYKPMANNLAITINCNVNENVPDYLLGDPLRLNQIISNLVNNAVKFTPVGHVDIWVSGIAKTTEIFELSIQVIDTGIGIPEDKLEEVFNSFTQSSSSTTRKYGGTGLGLAIVKELVEMQQGEVSLKSKLNEGTTFTVNIPFAISAGEADKEVSENNTSKFNSLKDKKILIVEDNLINQKVARQILLKSGLKHVDVTDNGFQALAMLQNISYDLVLMDIQMPEIDGLETTRRIRKELKLSVPIIELTASALLEDKDVCFDAGMNGYIAKPFLPEDLLQKISALV